MDNGIQTDREIQNPVSGPKFATNTPDFFCSPQLTYLALMIVKKLEEKVGGIIFEFHYL